MIDQSNRWAFRCRANVAGERELQFAYRLVNCSRLLGLRPRNSSSLAWSLSLVRVVTPYERTEGLTDDSGACQTVVSQVSHSYPETLVIDTTLKYGYRNMYIQYVKKRTTCRSAKPSLLQKHVTHTPARPATIQ